jgi:hypothetical protein
MEFLKELWKDLADQQINRFDSDDAVNNVKSQESIEAENEKIIKALIENDLIELPFSAPNFSRHWLEILVEMKKVDDDEVYIKSLVGSILRDTVEYVENLCQQYRSVGSLDQASLLDEARRQKHNQLFFGFLMLAKLLDDKGGFHSILDFLQSYNLDDKIKSYSALQAAGQLLVSGDSAPVTYFDNSNALKEIDKATASTFRQAVTSIALRSAAIIKWQKNRD